MIVVVPMAGRGSRYENSGFDLPKPLIHVADRPMILWALHGLKEFQVSQFVFVLLREHEERFGVMKLIRNHVKENVSFELLDSVTDGQLSTVLKAGEIIDVEEDVLVVASDTLVVGDIYADACASSWDGLISVANLSGDRWSFAKSNSMGEVEEVAEKVRISDQASTGQYYFRHGKDLVRFGSELILEGERTKGEYYVIPVYQKMIDAGLHIGISNTREMWDLGTPEAKLYFEQNYRVS
ncbi:MAG: NTP transferase domain-containing protein [Cytophagales bacterium]|nr:NTP transferase domain-containing protein [Cytophagales bacterium]